MKGRKAILIAEMTAVVGLCSTLVFAQGNGNRGPNRSGGGGGGAGQGDVPPQAVVRMLDNQEMIAKIGLSSNQVGQLRDKLLELQKQEIQLRAQQQAAAADQASLMTRPEIDEKAVMKVVEQLGQVRTEMAKLQIKRVILLKKSLTDEQRAKLRAIIRERRERQHSGQNAEGAWKARHQGVREGEQMNNEPGRGEGRQRQQETKQQAPQEPRKGNDKPGDNQPQNKE